MHIIVVFVNIENLRKLDIVSLSEIDRTGRNNHTSVWNQVEFSFKLEKKWQDNESAALPKLILSGLR